MREHNVVIPGFNADFKTSYVWEHGYVISDRSANRVTWHQMRPSWKRQAEEPLNFVSVSVFSAHECYQSWPCEDMDPLLSTVSYTLWTKCFLKSVSANRQQQCLFRKPAKEMSEITGVVQVYPVWTFFFYLKENVLSWANKKSLTVWRAHLENRS